MKITQLTTATTFMALRAFPCFFCCPKGLVHFVHPNGITGFHPALLTKYFEECIFQEKLLHLCQKPAHKMSSHCLPQGSFYFHWEMHFVHVKAKLCISHRSKLIDLIGKISSTYRDLFVKWENWETHLSCSALTDGTQMWYNPSGYEKLSLGFFTYYCSAVHLHSGVRGVEFLLCVSILLIKL